MRFVTAVRTDSGNHILQFEIDVETGNIIGERRIISRGCGGRDVEAPHIYKRNGYYYLMTAEGGTREGHMVCIARSRSLWGPFHPCPYNPILSNRDHALKPLQNVGHGDLVDDNDGNWWMTALAVRQIKHKHNLGRETILVPVEWTEDGWPVVNERCAKEVIEIKYGFQTEENACVPLGNIPVKDNFDGKELLPCYNTMREFIPGHSMNLMNGKLCLTGNRWTLNDQETPVFIGRRQEEYSFRAETCMEFEPSIEKEEAGLALYMDTEHHMDFVIRKRHGNKVLFLRKTVNDLCTEEDKVELPEEQPVTLIIRGTRQYYIFSYQASGEEIIVGQTVIKNLATECANSAFTGVYIGMYASGNGHRMQATACYDYFLYENLPEEL